MTQLKTKPKIRKSITVELQGKLDRATRKLRRVQQAILDRSPDAAGVVFPPLPGAPRCVSALTAEYIANHPNLSPSTLSDRQQYLRRFAAFTRNRALTRQVVEEWCLSLHGLNHSAGYKWLLGVTSAIMLRWCADTKRLPEDYTTGIKWPRMPEQKPREPYQKSEFTRITTIADLHPRLSWVALTIRLGWFTGMALVDCCDLLWGAVDMQHCTITTKRRKTGTDVVIPFTFGGELHEALKKYQRETIHRMGSIKPSFPVNSRTYQNKTNALRAFKKIVQCAGLKYRSFHSWRGTFISDLVNNNVNIAVAMKMTGIKTVGTFAKYATIKGETLRTEISRIR